MPTKKLYLECMVLFFIIPGLLYFVRHQLAHRVFLLLLTLTLICVVILWKDPEFDSKSLFKGLPLEHLKSIVLIFLPGAALLTTVAYFALPSKFFDFPISKPSVWLSTMLLYPMLLVPPQEFLFRGFFFHRYRRLFAGRKNMLLFLNALSFSLAHLFYGNWIAPVLTFFGGLLFAWRYHASKGLLTVTLEHALWGNFLFTIGIGWYFYSGCIA